MYGKTHSCEVSLANTEVVLGHCMVNLEDTSLWTRLQSELHPISANATPTRAINPGAVRAPVVLHVPGSFHVL